ncbi:ABC transporter, ATP-binding protein [Geotalea daltonii FRC-32]|uniref:ABC transporter, ATP-binding protein n=1 Tax=Geotalea daltonii (strain DSM 22248 / JCM 15807 / FRC-32) TaxID=316067 RepID=B9M6S8_GEODF|nr:ABC transporter ATP-binding protein [Geotalea daltonii]ACM20138.1 ABC transporter, ATP-binding protein [Geotalea daltonii FRC-32]
MDAIKIDNLTKRFDAMIAVDGLTLTVSRGELFGLVGSDGAGKTTTMRMLAGIMDPSSGDAWIMDRHAGREGESLKGSIGYMSQRFGLYPDLTVLENIHFFADIHGLPQKGRQEKIDRLLAFSNLTPFKKRRAGNLSGGMKQKLGLACALIHTPQVLFLDEPTNGVDPVSRRDFWRILYQLLKDGVTIFVATAYLDEADRCNRVGLIHKGKLVACGTPQELKQLMPGGILEVHTGNARACLQILHRKLEGYQVGLFGDRLHIVSETPEKTQLLVQDLLGGEGVEIVSIRQIEPSLEDIFISVIGEEDVHATAG